MRSLWIGTRATTVSPSVEEREATARAAPTHRVVEVVWTRGGGRRADGLRVRVGSVRAAAHDGPAWRHVATRIPALGSAVVELTQRSVRERAMEAKGDKLMSKADSKCVPSHRRVTCAGSPRGLPSLVRATTERGSVTLTLRRSELQHWDSHCILVWAGSGVPRCCLHRKP